jgi:hypothetical protein
MTETTTYDNLRFSISRIMMDDVPHITRVPDSVSDAAVAAKLYMGEDSGWHIVRGLSRKQLGRFAFQAVVEEHRQRPTLADPKPEAHVCSSVGCYCFTVTEDNIFYGWGRDKAQTANPSAIAKVLDKDVMHMCGAVGFDIFAEKPESEQSIELGFLRGLRGPADQPQQLFMSDALGRVLDVRLGIIPQ